ncbi:uncharacterized protein LOC113490807 isoform X2 [Athene cunicularia]|uniref:uncharacterized protein LOC113490807 isoform X2 n=1 Tax=Athene cunicularia TaxID=194338 RepID=UPI000EF719B0|nr:uncharacterized protein LOC113490807 isoform X2 [Athene cunicularia]
MGQGAPPGPGEAAGAEPRRHRAPGERGTVTSVPVPGGSQPAGNETAGTTRVQLAAGRGAPRGGCWVSLGELPCPGWLIVAVCPSWGAGRNWAGRSLPAYVTVLIPGSTRDPSHHTLAPPKGPISAPTISAWPCWTHLGAHHLLLVLPNSSWCPSSLLGPAGPILASIMSFWSCWKELIMSRFSWNHLDVQHLCLVLHRTSWYPSSIPAHARPILVPVIFSCFSWTHLGIHHVLVLPNPISAPIISSRFCPTHLGTHHLQLFLHPSWCLLSPPGPTQPILVPILLAPIISSCFS